MKQGLQLNVSQQLTMTPALQQAIRLLQLSSQELQQEIQTALEENMMLELAEDQPAIPSTHEHASEPDTVDPLASTELEKPRDDHQASLATENDALPDITDDAADNETNWEDRDDYRQTISTTNNATNSADNLHDTALNMVGNSQPDASDADLHDYLNWQLEMSHCSPLDSIIAQHLIDAIDTDGLLRMTTQQAAEQLNAQLHLPSRTIASLQAEDIEPVVHRLQTFDPLGVATRDLRECLLVQLKHLPDNDDETAQHAILLATRIVEDYFPALSKRDLASIKRRSKSSAQALDAALHVIQNLNPRPGSTIGTTQPEYITPDVYVQQLHGTWQVQLNQEQIPRIRVNETYASMAKDARDTKQRQTARDHLTEARWLVKNLQNRSDTLLKVAKEIVHRQQAYFEQGVEALQPMVLREVADAVELHESTISRITSSKYMETPQGIVSFKYFFSSQVGTETGGGASSTAIQARIKRLINDENTRKPLSDNKLCVLLNDEGIQVARRTVAKYREALNIPSSSDRKQLT